MFGFLAPIVLIVHRTNQLSIMFSTAMELNYERVSMWSRTGLCYQTNPYTVIPLAERTEPYQLIMVVSLQSFKWTDLGQSRTSSGSFQVIPTLFA